MVSGVHYLELLIGQSSGWSRYDRVCGKGAAPATILITVTCVHYIYTEYASSLLYRINGHPYFHYHQPYLLFVHTSNNLALLATTENRNTSLAAPGALAQRLQRRTACKIQNVRQGAPKWPTWSGKGSNPRLLAISSHFC